jgi:hypothetical protein
MLAQARQCLVQPTIANSGLLGYRRCLELFQRGNTDRAVSADLDDTVGRCHLRDQVPVVSDSHELVQGRPANDGIEGEVDLRDIKDNALRVVVLSRPECDSAYPHCTGDGARRRSKLVKDSSSIPRCLQVPEQ